jgi:phospholipid/cholesterol/gamma-HCH transport system permease protein
MFSVFDNYGKSVCNYFRNLGHMFRFVYLTFRLTIPLKWHALSSICYNIVSQIYFTGYMALPLMTFIALATGSIIVLQSTAQLSILGSQEMMGNILVVTIVRELGPLLTALIVIARSGTAVASELGNMQVNKEIETLRVMSIEPLSYVVFPRLIGGIISLLCLAFYFNIIALFGGFLVGKFVSDLTFSFYLDVLSHALTPHDFTLNIFKNMVGGLIIFTIACDQGFKVKNGPHEVPMATTNAVVSSIVMVMGFNLSITILVFAKDLL